MATLGRRKSLRSKSPDEATRRFTRSQFGTERITTGSNAGKIMVRFKPPGVEAFRTLAIVDSSTEAKKLIRRMQAL